MSSPLNRTWPAVIVYPGRPIRTFASVDLPEPFGPIIACVSPWRTTRSIPLRIGLSSTDASRPRISSVAGAVATSARVPPFVCIVSLMAASSLWHLDHHVVALDLHRERLDGLRRGERAGATGVQVERRPVLRALERLVLHVELALVQEVVRVRADRIDDAEAVLAQVRDGVRTRVELDAPGLA